VLHNHLQSAINRAEPRQKRVSARWEIAAQNTAATPGERGQKLVWGKLILNWGASKEPKFLVPAHPKSHLQPIK